MVVAGGREPNFFFKIILSPILQDKTLRIPQKFVREFRNDLSSSMTLVVPGEKSWTVRLVSEGDELWFCDGLDEFFEFYSVSFGYFLLFEYRGNSEFRVRIFDLTACEISYPSIDASQKLSPSKQADRFQLRSEEASKANAVKEEANCTPDHDEDDDDADCTDNDDDDDDANCTYDDDDADFTYDNSYDVDCASDDDVVVLGRPDLVPKSVDVVELSSDDEDQPCAKNKDDFEIARSNVGDGGGELCSGGKNVKNRIFQSKSWGAPDSSIDKPKNVSFRAVMKPYNIEQEPMSLNIPAHIGRKFPRGVSGLVKLEVSDGRRWMVQGNFLGGRLRSLGNGWAEFARQTKLKVDDVCRFELITNDKEFSMKVSMYRNKPLYR